MASTKTGVVENLDLLLQHLSVSEPIDSVIHGLSESVKDDPIVLAFVNYVNRYKERGGNDRDLSIFIESFKKNLSDETIDDRQLLKSLIQEASHLEEKTAIFPSTSDGFDDCGSICADKLEELFTAHRSGRETGEIGRDIQALGAYYGMFRLIDYIDRFDGDSDYQLVRALLLQGQEYSIGADQLLRSTNLSATPTQWGVEEFLVNPMTQEFDNDLVSFFDEIKTEKEQSSTQQAFDDLFDDFSTVENEQGNGEIAIEFNQSEEQSIDFNFDSIFVEEENTSTPSTAIEQEVKAIDDFFGDDVEDVAVEQELLDFSLLEEENQPSAFESLDQPATTEESIGSEDNFPDDLFAIGEDEATSETLEEQLEEQFTFDFDVENENRESFFALEETNTTAEAFDFFDQPVTSQEPIGLEDSFLDDLFAIGEDEATSETLEEQLEFNADTGNVESLEELELLAEEDVEIVSEVQDEFDESDTAVTEDVISSLPLEERQDVTEILDTFAAVPRRMTLLDLGLSDLVTETIGDDVQTIDYSSIIVDDDEPIAQAPSIGEDELDFSVEESLPSEEAQLVVEDEFSFLNEESIALEEAQPVVEDEFSFLEEEPIALEEAQLVVEDEFSFLEEEPIALEEAQPTVDEDEFSFLEEESIVLEEAQPKVKDDDFDEVMSLLEELTTEDEQAVNEVETETNEDATILQDVPEFFATIGDASNDAYSTDEQSIDDLLNEFVNNEARNDEDDQELSALLSEVTSAIPDSNMNNEENVTVIQEMPEFFASLTEEQSDQDDTDHELEDFLSSLESEDFNIRQYDRETEVIELDNFVEEEEMDSESFLEQSGEDDDFEAEDDSDELSKLFGEISQEDLDEVAETFSSEEDDSGFFFFQGGERQIDDDDSEISLIELFNAERNGNGEIPDDVMEELDGILQENDQMSVTEEVFDDLEALLNDNTSSAELDDLESLLSSTVATATRSDAFEDLDALLESMPSSKFETKAVAAPKTALNIASPPGPNTRSTMAQNMRVDVRYLDNINNLVGELIVNRNLLQQDQVRLQGSLITLFSQINKLNDVAQRVRDEFDRSLLERSLKSSFGSAWMDLSDNVTGKSKTVAIKSADTGDALSRLDEHDELNNLALDIIELITRVKESASDVEFVIDETQQVGRQLGTITSQIEDDLKQVRMEPFSEISDRLPKQVRDLALRRKKQADVEITGRETMIDKAILQGLNTPINHLITNALVHGIEDPEVRVAAGKDARGKVSVKAYHQGNETIISISDDGGGINPEKVRQSAISKGLLTLSEARLLSDQDTYSLLFRPGFSTKSEVDEEGGRGVGLDAVITQLNSIKGTIQVESAIGKGTTFTIRLPLTLSISKAMVCLCNRNRVAFPVDSFEDIVEITQEQVFVNSSGQTCFQWRDMELPFRPLSEMLIYNRQIGRLGFMKADDDIISVIILRSEKNLLALQVDKFDGEIEIVIKQVEGPVVKPAGIAGVTVLGDGKVMAICNVLELFGIASGNIGLVRHDQASIDVSDQERATTVLVVDDSVTMRKALAQTFEKAGYRVEEARHGKEALDKLRGGLFCDLIFSDVEMPQMNGFQLLEKLQKDEELSRIPVAMLTSQGKRVHIENAANLGAKGYFVKAYTDQEVLEGAERLLKGQVAGKILEVMS